MNAADSNLRCIRRSRSSTFLPYDDERLSTALQAPYGVLHLTDPIVHCSILHLFLRQPHNLTNGKRLQMSQNIRTPGHQNTNDIIPFQTYIMILPPVDKENRSSDHILYDNGTCLGQHVKHALAAMQNKGGTLIRV